MDLRSEVLPRAGLFHPSADFDRLGPALIGKGFTSVRHRRLTDGIANLDEGEALS